MENNQYPSVRDLQCPSCKGTSFKIIGTKGSMGKAVGAAMFGAIGNMAMSAGSKNDFEIRPIRYQCLSCRSKFEATPLTAAEDELLEEPCTVVLRRLSSVVGMAVLQQVFLNGVKVGNVKNNGELTFRTYTKHNTICVTDQSGVAFPGAYTFVAESGGTQTVQFKRKFV